MDCGDVGMRWDDIRDRSPHVKVPNNHHPLRMVIESRRGGILEGDLKFNFDAGGQGDEVEVQ